MTNETKHTADARPWHIETHPENSEIKYIRFGDGGLLDEVCVLYSSNAKANAAHIVKCVNAHDDLVEALEQTKRFIEFMPKGIGRGAASPLMQKIEAALKKASE